MTKFWDKLELGLGRLRAMAQGYKYSYINIEVVINFQKNLTSCGIKLGWGLDGCARWREVTITITIQLSWGVVFKII